MRQFLKVFPSNGRYTGINQAVDPISHASDFLLAMEAPEPASAFSAPLLLSSGGREMKFKKVLALLLALMLVVTVFAGCANNSGDTTTDTNNTTDTTDTTNTPIPPTPLTRRKPPPSRLPPSRPLTAPMSGRRSPTPSPRPLASTLTWLSTATWKTSSAPPCRAATIPTSSIWPPVVKPA